MADYRSAEYALESGLPDESQFKYHPVQRHYVSTDRTAVREHLKVLPRQALDKYELAASVIEVSSDFNDSRYVILDQTSASKGNVCVLPPVKHTKVDDCCNGK